MLTPLTQPLIPLTDAEFALFQKLIYDWAGIHMGNTKQALVTGRLMKRVRHYGFSSFSEYLKLVRDEAHADEKQIMINLLTTNETYFFREPKHFAWLKRKLAAHPSGETFRLWSAACSSGQEVYSLAMVLADTLGERPWQIVGSDISEQILEVALQATYPIEQASQISPEYLKKFCLKGVAEAEGTFCIQSTLLKHIRFMQVNLIEPLPAHLGEFDAIFLRNVMIYFDRATRQKVSENLARYLKTGGHLVIGHAESLHGISEVLKSVEPTIYTVIKAPARQTTNKTES